MIWQLGDDPDSVDEDDFVDLGDFDPSDFADYAEIRGDLDDLGFDDDDFAYDDDGMPSDLDSDIEDNTTNYGYQLPAFMDEDEIGEFEGDLLSEYEPFEDFDLPDMDDFDPYDDDHISGYLIDDLGDDDADFEDDDLDDELLDLLDYAPPEGAHLVEDEMWETSDDGEFE